MIYETSKGQISEINKDGTHLWMYRNPTGTSIYNQFDDIQGFDNSLFRGEKYPNNYPGFARQDLTPIEIVEDENSGSDVCINGIGVDSLILDTLLIQNPVIDNLLVLEETENVSFLKITDLTGKIIFSESIKKTEFFRIFLPSSLYLVQIITEKAIYVNKIVVL